MIPNKEERIIFCGRNFFEDFKHALNIINSKENETSKS